MTSQTITFPNFEGKNLSAVLELPDKLNEQEVRGYVLFSHCFTCNKDLPLVKNIAKAFTEHNLGVFRFDFTGLGQSEGDFSETNFSSTVKDLEMAVKFMTEKIAAPKLIVGHSLGGAAAIFAAKLLPTIEAVATIGAPAHPLHVQKLFKDNLAAIKQEGQATVAIAGRNFLIKKEFLEDITRQSKKNLVYSLKKPLLILHSPQDEIVHISNAAEIYEAAHHPKSFISLDGANHLLSSKKDSTYAGNVIASWAERYIHFSNSNNTLSTTSSPHQVTVAVQKSFSAQISARSHRFTADEPKELGGDDQGPTPSELLLSSLGSCTAITLEMYAKRKGWSLDKVVIQLNQQKEGTTTVIKRDIVLRGDLDATQRKRLLEIANKCPIHKTMQQPIKVVSELVEI